MYLRVVQLVSSPPSPSGAHVRLMVLAQRDITLWAGVLNVLEVVNAARDAHQARTPEIILLKRGFFFVNSYTFRIILPHEAAHE